MLEISNFLVTVNYIDLFSNCGIPKENYYVLHFGFINFILLHCITNNIKELFAFYTE